MIGQSGRRVTNDLKAVKHMKTASCLFILFSGIFHQDPRIDREGAEVYSNPAEGLHLYTVGEPMYFVEC